MGNRWSDTNFRHLSQFLGKLLDITPLGQGFSRFFPCFLLLPVLATLFNVYGKTKNILGFGVLEDESEDNPSGFGTGGWREGKTLVDRDLQSRGTDITLGLAIRGASLDLEQADASSSSAGRLRTLGAEREERPVFPDADARKAANRQFDTITNQQEEEVDDSARHFYHDFRERVQNTFASVEKPEFMRNIGSAFQTPRWMEDNEASGSVLSKWFGGRPEDGRLRL